MEDNIKIGKNGTIRVVWNVKPTDYSQEKDDSLVEIVSKKYGVDKSKIKIEPHFVKNLTNENGALTYDSVHNITDPKFQQSLFWDYLKENDITDYDEDVIIAIDSQVNAQIDYDSFEQCRKYDIKYVKWDNFLSYGPGNYFDFTKLKGLVLLNGLPANQSGKSTFSYDLIHFALHGKTSSGKVDVLADYFNKYTPEATEVFVEIGLVIDNEDYIIRRKLTRPELGKKNRNKITQTVEYFKVENGVEFELTDEAENLKNGTSQQTNKLIKEAIGNEKDFDLVICANSDNLKNLISMKDTERGRLMSRWIGLSPLEKKETIAKDMWNHSVTVGLKSSVYNKETLKNEVETIKSYNAEFEKQIASKTELVNDADKKLQEYDAKKEELLKSLKSVDNTLLDVDVVTVEQQIATILQQGAAKKALIENKTNEINAIQVTGVYDEETYRNLQQTRLNLNSEITNLRNEIGRLRQLNKDLEKSEFCPTCGARLKGVDNSELIKKNEETINQLIQKGITSKASFDDTETKIAGMESDRTAKINKDKLELQVTALKAEKDALLASWREKKKLKEDYEKNIDAIKFNNNVNNNINLLKENIRVQEDIKMTSSNDISSMRRDIDNNNGVIREKESLIETIIGEEKLIKNWKLYLILVGKNGISKMVLRKALPIINAEVGNLLDGVCDFKVEVSIDDSNDVAFSLIRNGVKSTLASGSGYEQTVSALALRVVLGKMSTLSKPPFLLLDEVLGGVAKENYDNVKKLYDRIVENYSFVFQISHLSEIVDWHDMVVTVKKDDNGISSIV